METEGKYGIGNAILQNGNENEKFYKETETTTEHRILAELSRKQELSGVFLQFEKPNTPAQRNLMNTFRPNQEHENMPCLGSCKKRPRLGRTCTRISSPSIFVPNS